ncbi:MAG: polyphenol oxidase family protein [Thermoanaerobaculum sp.]|nr:polyphenol oxidase family protein [Thermoanaerobaculum sp.]
MSGEGVTLVRLKGAWVVLTDARACPRGFAPGQLPELLARHLPFRPAVLYPRQRHTNLLYTFSGPLPSAGSCQEVGVCDGLITGEPGVALAIQTADCLPIALAGGGVIAAVHAGWRGLAAGIVSRAPHLIAAQFGVPPQELSALIGVGIAPCHYPVGEEVAAAVAAAVGTQEGVLLDGRLDLAAAALQILTKAGVPWQAIHVKPGCTACSPHYHSHRRDGAKAGRQWFAVVLDPR